MFYVLALFVGIIAGLRAMTAPAAIAWAAHLGVLDLTGSWLNFFAHAWTPWIFTVLALGELVTDQLPSTPSRTVPVQFGTRLLSGGICGAAIGFAGGSLWAGAVAGVIGAAIGTLGGRACRAKLAVALGKDRPAAFIEDAVAIAGAALIVVAMV
ncbi:hypothetical protein [Povalibacter sp.]|uniref:hypothetical protein n=1 Tax=Povalibacter sp. TaxID=1962978 RepID=UPI002F3F164B